jgi:hypothetical protein
LKKKYDITTAIPMRTSAPISVTILKKPIINDELTVASYIVWMKFKLILNKDSL